MPICESCGKSIQESNYAFCPFCGRSLSDQSDHNTNMIHCRSCNKEILGDSIYCQHCGAKQNGETQSINTNPPIYIDKVNLWLSGPRQVIDGGWTKQTQVGRWINFSFTLKDEHDLCTACNGELMIAVLKSNATLPAETPVEKILFELDKKSYFVHHYDFKIQDFNVINNELTAVFKNTSELVYCDRDSFDGHYFHFLVKPENMDWLVWRPSILNLWGGPHQIKWD